MEDTLKRRVSGRKRAREKTKDTPNKWRDEQETNRNPTRRRKIDNEDRNMAKHQKNMNRSDLVTNKGTSFDECWFANSFHASSRAKSHQNPSSEVGGTSLVKNIIGSSASKEHFSQGDDDISVPDIHQTEHLSVSSVNESIFSNLSASTPKTDRKDKSMSQPLVPDSPDSHQVADQEIFNESDLLLGQVDLVAIEQDYTQQSQQANNTTPNQKHREKLTPQKTSAIIKNESDHGHSSFMNNDSIFDGIDFIVDSPEYRKRKSRRRSGNNSFTTKANSSDNVSKCSGHNSGEWTQENCDNNDISNQDSGNPEYNSELDSKAGVNHIKTATVVRSLKDHMKKVELEMDNPPRNCGVDSEVGVKHIEKTPTGGRSLKDRLKKALQDNAHVRTPQSRVQQMKEESVQLALEGARLAQLPGGTQDVGPFYGLPSKVQELFETQRGIKKLYAWQDECLSLPAVRAGHNLIYSLPTSGGKTLVAEILILKELLCRHRDAILILPFVSIVQEKVRNLSSFAVDLDFLVEEYAGSKGQYPPRVRRKRRSLYVCTIEKANSLINALLEAGRIKEIGLIVVDEIVRNQMFDEIRGIPDGTGALMLDHCDDVLSYFIGRQKEDFSIEQMLHMLGEGGSRGATLEMSLIKAIHMTDCLQVIGMSATLSNVQDVASFLKAQVYTNDFRPVALHEYVKLEDNVYEVNQKAMCPDDKLTHSRCITFPYTKEMIKRDPDHIVGLVSEVIPQYSCLVFCPTKKNCENVAELICKMMPQDLMQIKYRERRELVKAIAEDGNGEVCPVLRRTIRYGVAYHHSGLTMEERRLIEEAYSDGTLCLLACTSTLAAGVNLPAKRVILRSANVGAQLMSRSQYKQMVGRAGRAGIDDSGESILIVKKTDRDKILDLLGGPFEYCRSSLMYDEGKGLRHLLLTTVGLKMTTTIDSVVAFVESSMYAAQASAQEDSIRETCENALQQLLDLALISKNEQIDLIDGTTVTLDVSKLGRATYKGSVDIDRAGQLYKDLCNAQEALNVANYLHLLYLATPYDLADNIKPNWSIYYDQYAKLDASELATATLIGVPESYLAKKTAGQRVRKGGDEKVVSRFYLTLMLHCLWKQKSIWEVSDVFSQPRGFLQNLLSSAASFAACIAHFCQELEEFWAYQDLLSSFVKKLSFCASMELIPLMEIPGVKQGRARQFYHAGYRSLSHIASVDPDVLVKTIEHLPRKAAKQIVASAKMLVNEKAEALREEAEEIVTMPTDMPLDVPMEAVAMATDSQLSKAASSQWSQSSINTT